MNEKYWRIAKHRFKFPDAGLRRSGKSTRVLMQAAYRASIGENVTVYGRDYCTAEWLAARFMQCYQESGFTALTASVVRQPDTGACIVFNSIGGTYPDYCRTRCGSLSTELVDDAPDGQIG